VFLAAAAMLLLIGTGCSSQIPPGSRTIIWKLHVVDAQKLHQDGFSIKSHFFEDDAGVLVVETWADPELSEIREEWVEILLKRENIPQGSF
jgi:hypothetical protein